jgi:hypothetical protein
VFSQGVTEFSATFQMVNPATLSGALTGKFYYSLTNKAYRYDYDVGYNTIALFDPSKPNAFFTFTKCSSKCDINPQPAGAALPRVYFETGDTCAATTVAAKYGKCTVCTKRDTSSGVASVCVADTSSYTPLQFTLNDGTVVDLSILGLAATVPNTLFDPLGLKWGCILNCNQEIDICYLVDESGSISGDYVPPSRDDGEWHDIRTFSFLLVNQFKIAPDSINMGLTQFAVGARNTLPSIISDSTQYNSVIQGLTKCKSSGCQDGTYTGTGFINCVNLLIDYTGARILRKSVPKMIVIITDGNNNQPSNPFSWAGRSWKDQPVDTSDWLNYVHTNGIQVVSIGVGDAVDLKYLSSLATNDASGVKMSYLASYANLTTTSTIQKLGTTVCTNGGSSASPCGTGCLGACICSACSCPNTCDRGNKCETGVCNATTNYKGGCFYTPVSCDDNDACTDDKCDPAGGCTHAASDCSLANKCKVPSCDKKAGCVSTDLKCDDNNACTVDTCDPATGCKYATVVCDDSDPCTDDACDKNLGCTHTAKVCTTNPCIPSTCVASNGSCSVVPNICLAPNNCTITNCYGLNGAPPCNYSAVDCTGGNKCKNAACDPNKQGGCIGGSISCDDKNACTDDSCDPASGCKHVKTNCDDADACTTDSCDLIKGCSHVKLSCDDGNNCTNDACDKTLGCQNVAISCTGGNKCQDSLCNPRTGCNYTNFNISQRCDDGNICTNDTCDPNQGCSHVNITCVSNYTDFCIVATCDHIKGCINVPRTCVPKDNCHVSLCDSTQQKCVESDLQSCVLAKIVGATAGAVLGAAAIAGICIAAAVIAGGGAAAAYYGYNHQHKGEFENKNPLYEPETKVGTNQLYNAGGGNK